MKRLIFLCTRLAIVGIFLLVNADGVLSQGKNGFDVLDLSTLGKPANDIGLAKSGVNNACATATVLTIDGPCNSETTNGCNLQVGESTGCITAGGGVTLQSDWYRFNTGTLNAINLSWLYTNSFNCFPGIAVWGPFAPGLGCLPSGAPVHCLSVQNGSNGYHRQLTGLTAGSDYLIQIVGRSCGGPNDGFLDYCVTVSTPQPNNAAGAPNLIDQCGVSFNGTNSGYSPSGGTALFNDLDNNAGTQCGTCGAGAEVPYSIENDSWFNFCATTAGTWQVNLSSVSNCYLGAGIQLTLMRGTSGNLTFIETAANPQAPGSTWASATFAVAAGECIYMVVDGFAGDMCDYSYTLTNITGGCNLLDVNFIDFQATANNGKVDLNWTSSSSDLSGHFKVERSVDNEKFKVLSTVILNGQANEITKYHSVDLDPPTGLVYYRITFYDDFGNLTHSEVKSLLIAPIQVNEIHPNPASDLININLDAYGDYHVDVRIISLSGQTLVSKSVEVTKGNQQLNLDVNHLARGVYFVQVQSKYKVFNSKLILE